MSKYIDADLYVEMEIFDDEHEEWKWWKGTIEELLDQWTEQGCPTPIEVSEDCISRKWLEENKQVVSHTNEWGETEINEYVCWEDVENAPSVVPTTEQSSKVGEWELSSDDDGEYGICSICGNDADFTHYGEPYNYCPNCGAKMKG